MGESKRELSFGSEPGECTCDDLYQQRKWGCTFGGSYVQVPTAGETGIQDQLLGTLSSSLASGGIHTVYMYIYFFTGGPPSCSDQDKVIGARCTYRYTSR